MVGYQRRWTFLFPGPYLFQQLEYIVSQLDDLRAAISQVGTDLSEAVTRIEAKLADTDVDLSSEIEALRSYGETLDSIAVDGPPVEPPVDEPPVDEPPLP